MNLSQAIALPSSKNEHQYNYPHLIIAAASVTAILLIARTILDHHRKKKQHKLKYGDNNYHLPPFPPFGFFETAEQLTSGQLPWFFLSCRKSVGDIFQLNTPVPGGICVVGDGRVQKQIAEDSTTTKPIPIYKKFNYVFNGNPVVLTMDGVEWKHRIKPASAAFASHHIKRMNEVCKECTEKWIRETLQPMVDDDKAFDASQEMIKLSVKVISKAAFEYEMSSEEAQYYVDEMTIALNEYQRRTNGPLRILFGSWWCAEGRRGTLATRRLHAFAMKVIESYHRKQQHGMDNNGTNVSSSSNNNNTLIRCIMNNEAYKNDDERASEINTFFLAGHDTTGNSIAWTLIELAKHPMELSRLREVLSSTTAENWSKMHALQYVVKEAMRLHPVIAGGPVRKMGRDFYIKERNILIPKGMHILMPNILTGRDPKVFEEPDKFVPLRWGKNVASVAWNNKFFPFTTGRHSCPGQALALAELYTVIGQIVRDYNLEIVDEGGATFDATSMRPVRTMLKAHKKSQ